MKLPAWSAASALRPGAEPAAPAAGRAIPAAAPYRLSLCIAPLYATDHEPGHPRLKHCFVRIEDGQGAAEYWGYGRGGLAPEPYPDQSSVHCWTRPQPLDAAGKASFMAALAESARSGYQWGRNDCCSGLLAVHRRVFAAEAPPAIGEAARDLAASPEVFPR